MEALFNRYLLFVAAIFASIFLLAGALLSAAIVILLLAAWVYVVVDIPARILSTIWPPVDRVMGYKWGPTNSAIVVAPMAICVTTAYAIYALASGWLYGFRYLPPLYKWAHLYDYLYYVSYALRHLIFELTPYTTMMKLGPAAYNYLTTTAVMTFVVGAAQVLAFRIIAWLEFKRRRGSMMPCIENYAPGYEANFQRA